jgi:hypothetical protein
MRSLTGKLVCWSALGLCALAGCSRSPPESATADSKNTAPAREISLRPEQVRFDRTGIATAVRVERRPASRLKARPDPGTQATPAQLLIVLDPATLPDPAVPESRALIVYPAIDWSRTYARLGRASEDPVPVLKKLLDEQPADLSIEFPPAPNHVGAHEALRAGIRYLEFHHGRGVRFLTVYQADPLPVSDRDVLYVFHGLTNDGRYWVKLELPLTSRALPPSDVALAALADYDRFVADHARYLGEVASKLTASRPDDFAPRLDRLDEMIESLGID